MRLIELLDVTNEGVEMTVHDLEGTVLGHYDGRDSINPVFNDREIDSMDVWKDHMYIFLS